jgi:hypothetical protein
MVNNSSKIATFKATYRRMYCIEAVMTWQLLLADVGIHLFVPCVAAPKAR